MIVILGKLFRGSSLSIGSIGRSIKSDVLSIRQDIEEHLQAINENTNEISGNYEYLCEIEGKLDSLSQRVDKLQLSLDAEMERKKAETRRLSVKEKAVFLAIYTLEDDDGITYEKISARLGISEQLAASYVTSLIEKGIPIVKRYINSRPHLKLDQEFKTLQAKENILQVGLEEFGF